MESLPDGGPEPVALWHFCHNFYPSVCNSFLAGRSKASRSDRVYYDARRAITRGGASGGVGGSTSLITCEIQGVAIEQLFGCNKRALEGESWNNMKFVIRYIRIRRITSCPIESTSAIPIVSLNTF